MTSVIERGMFSGRSQCESRIGYPIPVLQHVQRSYSYPYKPIEEYEEEEIIDAKNILEKMQYDIQDVYMMWDEKRIKEAILTALACIRGEQHRRETQIGD